MRTRHRLTLLSGCVFVAALEAPGAMRALRAGLDGPYRAPTVERGTSPWLGAGSASASRAIVASAARDSEARPARARAAERAEPKPR